MAGGTEIFRAIGTVALEETGNIRSQLTDIMNGASGATTKLGAMSAMAGTVGVAVGALAGVIGGALVGGVVLGTKKADEFKNALNDLASDTNTAEKDTKALGQTLKNVYKAGFGEDINDTAEAMKSVSQATNASGKELENYSKKIITLSDKLDSEYNETMRSAKVLSENFGISIDEAFELMAQGQAKGLNSQGDMLDVLNEYSIQFSKSGKSAEDFFETLISGNEKGVYSYDKLADMQKEFGIRIIDNSKLTQTAFSDLGLSYSEYSQVLAEGGEKGANAQKDILQAILAIEDPVKQNEIGVALLGTMYEDLGNGAVEALVNIGDNIDLSKNKMQELIDIRFDSVGEKLEVIKRKFETNILLPVGEFVLPIVIKLLDTFEMLWTSFRTSPTDEFREKIINMFPESFQPTVALIVDTFLQFFKVLTKIKNFIVDSFVPALKYIVTGEGLENVQGAGKATTRILESLRKEFVKVTDYINNTLVPALRYLATGEGLEKVDAKGTDLKKSLEKLRGQMVSLKNYITETLIPALVYLATGEGLGKVKGASDDTKRKLEDLRKGIEKVVSIVKNFSTSNMVNRFSELIKSITDTIGNLKTAYDWIKKIYSFTPGGISSRIGSYLGGIGKHATGIKDSQDSHFAIVGEQGAELQYIPKGSDIYTAKETRNILEGLANPNKLNVAQNFNVTGQGGNVYNVNMNIKADDIRSISDIIDLFSNLNNEQNARYSY